MRRTSRLGCSLLGGAAAVLALVLPMGSARACDTPVYRYALYRWQPGLYQVYYFHRGPAKEDAEVNKLLEEAGAKQPAANLAYEAIDVSKPAEVDRLPDDVKKAWEKHRDKPLPLHVVFAPRERELWAGRLDSPGAKALLGSPIRKKIAQSLHDGQGAVLLLLPGQDAAENKKAEKVLRDAIARAAKPEAKAAEVPAAAPTGGPSAKPEGPEPKPAGGLQLGLLKLDRADAAEAWFVRCLLAIEDLKPEQARQPVLYAIFGRGRALGPCPNEAITADSLDQLTAFLGGACSCVIKDQNPGTDLLFAWDWDATAERLAADDETMKPDSPSYQEIAAEPAPKTTGSPEKGAALPHAGEGPGVKTAASPSGGAPAPSARPADKPSTPSPEPSKGAAPPRAGEGPGAKAAESPSGGAPAPSAPQADSPTAPSSASEAPGSSAEGSFATRQIWKFGVGLGAAAILVLGAGLILLRKSHS